MSSATSGETYTNPTDAPVTVAEALEAVRGAATALSGQWADTWIVRLENAAALLVWQARELEEVRRIADEEYAELQAELDAAGVPPAHAIEGANRPLVRIFQSSTFETVNRLRWLLASRWTWGSLKSREEIRARTETPA